jgi:N-dimethylarginine dimethylaminohydrolase
LNSAAYGGEGWSLRRSTHREEIGSLWAHCGLNSEWLPLKQVLLHPPGAELSSGNDPKAAQLLEIPDWQLARHQHVAIAQAYRAAGISVHFVDPAQIASPNLIFCADLFFMTPQGAILARPASTVRAGEERWVARRLADRGVPILRTLSGAATFEGADALWLDPQTVLLGCGFRTNAEGARQVCAALSEIGVETIPVDLPVGAMHLMGILRFLDRDLALAWPARLAWRAVEALRARGFAVRFLPDETEATLGGALNFVTLGPRQVLMAAGNPITRAFLAQEGVACHEVVVGELLKAAGGIACLTGIVEREMDRVPPAGQNSQSS